MSTTLERQSFSMSRELEYFTERELSMQLGEGKAGWPIMLVKELVDNALDACESKGIPPEIQVTVEPDAFTVSDNGPGLPVSVLRDSLNYQVRISDKAHYVSPSRGQLGNALKCVWAGPFVASGCRQGVVEVGTAARLFKIVVEVNQIEQRPEITMTEEACPDADGGTFVKIHWPGLASSKDDGLSPDFYKLVERIALFNPHAHLSIAGLTSGDWPATSPTWTKWSPSSPTSPHWYSAGTLGGLVAAYIANGSGTKTVREFVSEFAGLSGSAKQKRVTEQAGLSGGHLSGLAAGKAIDATKVMKLLAAMQAESRPIKPEALGILGEDHFRARNASRAFRYKKQIGHTREGMPFVVEVAFDLQAAGENRRIAFGLNWTAANSDSDGGSLPNEIESALSSVRAREWDPIRLAIHIVCPRLEFKDHGKTSIEMPPEMAVAISKCIETTGKTWKQAKRNADREGRVRERELEELRREEKRMTWSIKDAAYHVMRDAYLQASGDMKFPADARQVMYAARPLVMKLTGDKCWKKSSYFTQTLLPDFIKDHPDLTADWDVVFDARGQFLEPHTGNQIDLGTAEVRGYIGSWRSDSCVTRGPANRFQFVLFVEKEGFFRQLKLAQIQERFDVALFTTKGMTVTAARSLVEKLSAEGVTTLVLHDFDKSGFSILHTLRSDTRRFQFDTAPKVVELGLRLADVERLKLESEAVDYDDAKDPRENLAEGGATQEEQDFLVQRRTMSGWSGQRVELNAMTAPQFIQFVEDKLTQAGCTKVVPDVALLKEVYQEQIRERYVADRIAQVRIEAEMAAAKLKVRVPKDIAKIIRKTIEGTAISWNTAVRNLAENTKEAA